MDIADSFALVRPEASILSPLRYPGAKRRLSGYIAQALQLNGLRPDLFVEPFAGGASVALQLLNDGMIGNIGLIERDPLVAAFWQTVFTDAEWLVDQVEAIDVTLDRWREFKRAIPTDARDRALACLFLNRTSFSGILAPGAGPLGGYRQASSHRLDCRFPRQTLAKRIRQAAALADRVAFVWEESWDAGLARLRAERRSGALPNNVFFYLDPPFFEKADRLYTYHFSDLDHRRLRDAVLSLPDPWLLSYDAVAQVGELYGEAIPAPVHVDLLYSASRTGGSRESREAIITNLPQLPQETRLWRRSAEWGRPTSVSRQPSAPDDDERDGLAAAGG